MGIAIIFQPKLLARIFVKIITALPNIVMWAGGQFAEELLDQSCLGAPKRADTCQPQFPHHHTQDTCPPPPHFGGWQALPPSPAPPSPSLFRLMTAAFCQFCDRRGHLRGRGGWMLRGGLLAATACQD